MAGLEGKTSAAAGGEQSRALVADQAQGKPSRGSGRAALIAAAAHVAREQGVSGLTVDAVVTRAGVSKGAFFHHFNTRREMVAALLADLAQSFEADLAKAQEAGLSFGQALVDATLAEVARDTGFLATLVGAVAEDRDLARVVNEQTEGWTRKMVEEGVSEPKARLIRAALDGLLFQCLLRAGATPPLDLLEALGRELATIIGS